MALERLADIPWNELHSAHGPAGWVPGILRALLGPDQDERSEALNELEGGIFKHETANEATPHVIPFLIELAASPSTPDRGRILLLLARMTGSEGLDPVPDQDAEDREFEHGLRELEVTRPDDFMLLYWTQWLESL